MKRAILLGVLVLLGLVGCGSTSSPSSTLPGNAKATVCQGLATINQSLTSLSNIGENTTVGQVKPVQMKISTVLTGIDKLIPSGLGSTLSDLQSANNQLGAAIQSYPDTATLGQTSIRLQGFKDQIAKAQSAQTKLASGLKCP